MPSDDSNYFRAALFNGFNLTFLVGAALATVNSGDWLLGLGAAGVEALFLVLVPELKPFQRAVRERQRRAREKAERKHVKQLVATLPEREWQRANALDVLRREVERDVAHNPSFEAILLQPELAKLTQLHQSFVRLAHACRRAEVYLKATDPRELERQLKVQETILQKMADPGVREVAEKNAAVLKKRMASMQDIETFLARARGHMTLIENSVRLLRDQALTMTRPEALTEQLDDLLIGVDAVQRSSREAEDALARPLEPVAAIAAEVSEAPGSTPRVRS